jgi:hypothetical protein
VPYSDLKSVLKEYKPTFIITSITTSPGPEELPRYIKNLCSDAGKAHILITGSGLAKVKISQSNNLSLFKDAQELQKLLHSI